jgi:hypothetical protein
MSDYFSLFGGRARGLAFPGIDFPGYAPDVWYPNLYAMGDRDAIATIGQALLGNNRLYSVPFFCLEDVSWNAMGFNNTRTTDSGVSVALGIYSCDAAGRELNRLAQITPITLDATAGFRQAPLSGGLAMKARTLYRLVMNLSATAGVETVFTGNGSLVHDFGSPNPYNGYLSKQQCRTMVQNYSPTPLPATAPALDTATTAGDYPPIIYLKR